MQHKTQAGHRGVPSAQVFLALLAALVMAVVAAGCGDDDSGSGNASGSDAGSSTQAAGAGKDVGDQTVGSGVTDYLKYVGGTAGKADPSKSPVVIGFVNQQNGPNDVGPGPTHGADLAVKYINEELGGIGGHPLELRKCFISTAEEQGQTCGQKMINDDDIHVVDVGAVALGSQSLNSTIDEQKPMVYGVSGGASDTKNKNGYILFGDAVSVSAPFGTFAKEVLDAKSVAVVWPEVPGFNEGAQGMIDGSKGNGLDVKRVSWAPNATDLVGPVTAAGGQTADAILTTSDAKGCVNLSKSLDQLKIDTPVVSQPLCLNPQVAKALGDIPQWYYGIASTLATDASDPAATAFMKVATKYGMAKEGAADVWVPVVFGQTLTIAQWLNTIGADNITDQTVAEQAKAFKGPLALGAPTIQCGKYPDRPAICSDQAKFYKYEGKGKFTPASGWLAPPE